MILVTACGLIATGAVVMGLAIWGMYRLLPIPHGIPSRSLWQLSLGLMVFFFLGYCLALVLLVLGNQNWLMLLIGTVFCFGAVFVYIVMRAGNRTIVLLQRENTTRQQAEKQLLQTQQDLEQQIQERTAALQEMNASLQEELTKRQEVENALRQSETSFRLMFVN